jgi:hypothetical protein
MHLMKMKGAEMSKELLNVDDLKKLAVKELLERFREHETRIEIVAAVSSDAAITLLCRGIYFDARLLQNVARADKATRELADKLATDIAQERKNQYIAEANKALDDLASAVDADGTTALQVAEDPDYAWAAVNYWHALDILRWLARSGDFTLTGEQEQEKDAALKTVVPTWESDRACLAAISDEEVTAAVKVLGRLAELS